MIKNTKTRLFTRSSYAKCMDMKDYIEAVAYAHRAHAENNCIETNLIHADAPRGEYHIKTGGILGENSYYGLKANGGFFENSSRYGLPNILGIIYLSNADNAYPIGIFESSLISQMRTAAATAVAAKYLMPKKPIYLTVIGYGKQAEAQIEAMLCVANIQQITIAGRNEAKLDKFIERISSKYHIKIIKDTIEKACRGANIIITCTPAKDFYIKKEWIKEGTFIAAVGADSPGKNELDPEIFVNAKIVGDIKSQIVAVGETQNPISLGIINKDKVHGDLGEVITGKVSGRLTDDEIIIYDSTGTAIQDIACAAYIYEKLIDNNEIEEIDFFN